MRWLVLGIWGLCASVFAATQCQLYRINYGSSTTYHASKASACSAGLGEIKAANPTSTFVLQGQDEDYCHIKGTNSLGQSGVTSYVFLTKTGDCDDQCKETIGQISTMNITRGWARSALPNKADQLGATSALPKRLCGGEKMCPYSVLGNEEAYRSQTPSAQGLYRLSSDVTVIQVEGSCTAADEAAAVNANTPDKPCPGQLGELNGKPYCAVTPDATGVDPMGSPGNSTDDKGNPTAGPKPGAGEGSGTGGVGRTPSIGNGGNLGGPAGAAAGGTGTKPGNAPDGKTDKPEEGKEQQACGAPGQPKCRIDETGTPTGDGKFDANNDGLEKGKDGWIAEIAKWKEKKWDNWSWTFQFPSGCSPLPLPGYDITINVCEWQPVIHGLMSMVWAIATVMGCLYLVFHSQKD